MLGAAVVNGDAVSLRVGHTYELQNDSATVRRHAFIAVEPARAESSIRELIDDYALAFRDLLALTTRSYTSLDRVSFLLSDDSTREQLMPATYLARLLRPMNTPSTDPGTAIFDLASLDISFDKLLPAWLTLRRLHHNTINMVVVPSYAPHTFTDTLLMTAWLAVEGYHESGMKQSGEAADQAARDHHARVDAIVAAAPAEFREWANQQLRERNAIGQRLKLEQLIERAGLTGAALLALNPNYVRNAVAGRRRVAHPTTYIDNTGAQFLFLANTLRWLITHCLLVDLGVRESEVARKISNDRHFLFDIESVARHHSKP